MTAPLKHVFAPSEPDEPTSPKKAPRRQRRLDSDSRPVWGYPAAVDSGSLKRMFWDDFGTMFAAGAAGRDWRPFWVIGV